MLVMDHPDAVIAIRTVVALVFLDAAVGKMRAWTVFQGVLANYRLIRALLIPAVAYALPPAEAAVGAALLTGTFSPWAEAAAAALLLVFAFAMAVNLMRGRRHIDCGCFQGTLKQTLRWSLVARNGVIALLIGMTAAAPSLRAGWWAEVNGLLAGCALFVVLQSLNALWSIVPVRRTQAGDPAGSAP